MTTAVSTVAAWLLTYLVHSTLLLGAVALLTHWVVRRESLREALWKAALVGGVVTATLAVLVPSPLAPRIDVAGLGGVAVAESGADLDMDRDTDRDTETATRSETGTRAEAGASREIEAVGQPAGHVAGAAAPGSSGEEAEAPWGGETPAWWIGGLLALWALVAAGLLARLAYRHVRLRLLLRDRTQVAGTEPAASTLTELRRTAGVWKPVRLTSSPSVATPLALGGVEICVPERFLTELVEEEQRVALAHELAHLVRRDPVWQVAGAVVGGLFFFQPLNVVARRSIRAAAEYLADGWAVAHTGARMELARCLASVAGWVAPSSEPVLAGTVAMAEGGSPLLARVERLLEREPEAALRPALRVAAAAVLVVAVAGFGPAVGGSAGGPVPGESMIGGGSVGETETAFEAGPQVDSLEVLRFDRPGAEGDGFVARLNEAGRDARQSPYWVAYAISSEAGARGTVMDTEPWSARELRGRPLGSMLGVEPALAESGPYPVIVLARLVPQGASTRVGRLTVRRPEVGMRMSGVVYWLGAAEPLPSYRWLRDIYQAVRDPEMRETLVEAIGIHPIPEAEGFLRRVLDESSGEREREEAMEGLTQRPDTAIARLLFETAMSDPALEVRREAAEQLGRVRLPLAVTLLERLTRESPDVQIQRQAAESLGELGTEAAVAALGRLVESQASPEVKREALDQLGARRSGVDADALVAMAKTDDDPDLRREAVELMEALPPDQAVAALRRVAFESGDGTAERQAAETLGAVGTPAALEALVEILERNPSEDASFQAVESIAENFPRDRVIPILRRILETHPSSGARREALDYLADMGG